MSRLDILKRQATRLVVLPYATEIGLTSGDLQVGEELVVRIRKVHAIELASAAGSVPQLFSLARAQMEGETEEEMKARLFQDFIEDSEQVAKATKQHLSMVRASVALAVTGYGIRNEIEDLRFSEDPTSEMPVDLLGADLDEVYRQVTEFSGRARRAGGADATATFPPKQASDPLQPSGSLLRGDPDGAPEPPVS